MIFKGHARFEDASCAQLGHAGRGAGPAGRAIHLRFSEDTYVFRGHPVAAHLRGCRQDCSVDPVYTRFGRMDRFDDAADGIPYLHGAFYEDRRHFGHDLESEGDSGHENIKGAAETYVDEDASDPQPPESRGRNDT